MLFLTVFQINKFGLNLNNHIPITVALIMLGLSQIVNVLAYTLIDCSIYNDKLLHQRSESHWIYVKTGDKKGADTDANIYIKLFSDTGKTSNPVKLNYHPRDYFKRGQVDTVLHKFITGSNNSRYFLLNYFR